MSQYNGHRIPKNSTIFINVWAIYHDENLFEEPKKFIPERFLTSQYGTREGIDPKEVANLRDMVFGAGRRVCPGMTLGRNSLLLNTARILWGFDILKAKMEDGTEIEIDFMDCKPVSLTPLSPTAADTLTTSSIRRHLMLRHISNAIFNLVQCDMHRSYGGTSSMRRHPLKPSSKNWRRKRKRSWQKRGGKLKRHC